MINTQSDFETNDDDPTTTAAGVVFLSRTPTIRWTETAARTVPHINPHLQLGESTCYLVLPTEKFSTHGTCPPRPSIDRLEEYLKFYARPIYNDLRPWLTFRHHRRRAWLIARYSMTSINRLYYHWNSCVLHYSSEIFIHLSRAWPTAHPSAQKYKRDIFATWTSQRTQSSLLNIFIHFSSRINAYANFACL